MVRKAYIPFLVLVLVFSFGLAFCSESSTEDVGKKEVTEEEPTEEETIEEDISEESVEKKTTEEEPAEEGTSDEMFAIGDTVSMGDLVFTLNSARWDEGDEFSKPEEGERWLVVDCTIENQSNESTTISSMLMFTFYDEDGYSMDQEIFVDTKGSLDGELGSGRKLSGEIAFSIEEGQSYWEFIFEPELFGFGQGIYAINEDEVQ